MTKDDLCELVVRALRANGGKARIVDICKYIWENHENDLHHSGDLFFTWQYDMRWAGQKLRDQGVLLPAANSRNGGRRRGGGDGDVV